MRPHTILKTPSVLAVIAKCWDAAERELRQQVETKHFDLDEEVLTILLFGELRYLLAQASSRREIETAFVQDLIASFPHVSRNPDTYRTLSHGLVAELSMHPRHVEKGTGGDFGLSFTRPSISEQAGLIKLAPQDHEQGILCQAKVRRRDGQWGGLTKNQKLKLKDRLDYLALCLYEYCDTERKLLKPLAWQSCSAVSIAKVSEWARKSSYPSLQDSQSLVTALGDNRIGTSDRTALDDVIHPAVHRGRIPSIQIRVTWRGGRRPPQWPVQVRQAQPTQQKSRVRH